MTRVSAETADFVFKRQRAAATGSAEQHPAGAQSVRSAWVSRLTVPSSNRVNRSGQSSAVSCEIGGRGSSTNDLRMRSWLAALITHGSWGALFTTTFSIGQAQNGVNYA